MSVIALPPPALVPLVGAARDALAAVGEVDLTRLAETELAEAVTQLTELSRRAESLRLAVLAQAERCRVAEQAAATGTDAWAAALTGDRREALAGGLRLARLLETTYAATREAFAAGRISSAQARVIVDAAEQAPDDATPAQVALAEQGLVDKATGDSRRSGRPMDPRRLRQAARRMFAPIDRELADRHEAILLRREERGAAAETWMRLDDNGDGTFSGRFTVPELHGHLLRHALERLTAPRRLNPGASRSDGSRGPAVVDESAPGPHLHEVWGGAFCELLEHLPEHGWAANGTTLLITVSLDALRADLVRQRADAGGGSRAASLGGSPTTPAAARLDTGVTVDASEARRLACGAGLMPVVLGGDSLPLDLGRTQRLHTPAQRRALSVVYDSCGVETCERPFAWCEVHHPDSWVGGGPTDLANAVPLCAFHHRRAHDDRFVLRRLAPGGWQLRPRRGS